MSPVTPWFQLFLGACAQLAGSVLIATPAFLMPLLHTEHGLSLAGAGTVATMPSLGMVFSLIAWGIVADRFGERLVLLAGLALGVTSAVGAAVFASGPATFAAWFLLAGVAVASSNVANGRLIMGWFPRNRRGLAMGIRQMAFSLGTALAALTIPRLAEAMGTGAALSLAAAFTTTALVVCAAFLREAPIIHPTPGAAATWDTNPYAVSRYLHRVHAASTLLTFPQLALQTFSLVFLINEMGWSAGAAGALVGTAQCAGAVGRIIAGILSDRIGRVLLIRFIAGSVCVAMLALAVAATTDLQTATAVLLVLASALSAADNGPAFTAVAEHAGPRWAGRALGTQNAAQYSAAFLVGPLVGGLITVTGFPLTFALMSATAAAALPLVPLRDSDHPG